MDNRKKEYLRKYVLEKYHKRREYAITYLGGKCAICGATENLQIDHIDRTTKTLNIARRIAGCSEAVFLKELDKCQLLCYTCHQKKTLEDLGRKPSKDNHGSISCYKNFGCRCELCLACYREYSREYRKKRKEKTNMS